MTQAEKDEILRGLMQDASGFAKPRLFIGGPLDGKYITVPYHGRPEPYIITRPAPPECQTVKGAIVVRQERYAPDVWMSHGISVVLMVHESVSLSEIMPRLIVGYRPEEPKP